MERQGDEFRLFVRQPAYVTRMCDRSNRLMSKLGCVCGHVIRDQTDNLPYKGFILRDKH